MSEYLITRRDKCPKCIDGIFELNNKLEPNGPSHFIVYSYCVKGYLDTPCDLIEVLSKLRWEKAYQRHPTLGGNRPVESFDNLRIVEDETQEHRPNL